MLVLLVALALWLGSQSPTYASININTDAVQKTVVFLYSSLSDGTADEAHPIGTGFFVDVPLKSDPTKMYRVLVTARHMVDPAWAQCPIGNPTVLYARLNKKGGGVGFIRLDLVNEGKPNWSHPNDDHVDAAVIPVPPSVGDFDDFGIPVALFPTEEEVKSEGIGDPIMSAGLLPALPGVSRNYPIFKFGAISNIPEENITTTCVQNGGILQVKVWLVAANLVQGNSGSPIFHVPLGGNGITLGGSRPLLLGIQSISFLGSDVAGMTPINYVYDLLKKLPFVDPDFARGPLRPPPTSTAGASH